MKFYLILSLLFFSMFCFADDSSVKNQIVKTVNETIIVETTAPERAKFNETFKYNILVKNVGTDILKNVIVFDDLPSQVQYSKGEKIFYRIGDMIPGASKIVIFSVKAISLGMAHNVVHVTANNIKPIENFNNTIISEEASQIQATLNFPESIVGQHSDVTFSATNSGDTALTNVVATIQFPSGIRVISAEPFGPQVPVTWNIGTLNPGQTVNAHARLVCTVESRHCIIMTVASAEGVNAKAESCAVWKGVAEIAIEKTAPARAEFGKVFNYNILVKNVGTGLAKNVVVVDTLPPQVEHPEGKTVRYPIGDMAPNASKTIVVQVKAIETGIANNKARATADNATPVETLAYTLIQKNEMPELLLDVIDLVDPLFVNSEDDETIYLIGVINQGTASDRNVTIRCEFPAEIDPIEIDGDTTGTIQGKKVTFQSYPQLLPKQKIQFQVTAKGVRAGNGRLRVYLNSEYSEILEEESTHVYENTDNVLSIGTPVQKDENADNVLSIGTPVQKDENADNVLSVGTPIQKDEPKLLLTEDVQKPIFSSTTIRYNITVRNQDSVPKRNIVIRCEFSEHFHILGANSIEKITSSISNKRVSFSPLSELRPGGSITVSIELRVVEHGMASVQTFLETESLKDNLMDAEKLEIYE